MESILGSTAAAMCIGPLSTLTTKSAAPSSQIICLMVVWLSRFIALSGNSLLHRPNARHNDGQWSRGAAKLRNMLKRERLSFTPRERVQYDEGLVAKRCIQGRPGREWKDRSCQPLADRRLPALLGNATQRAPAIHGRHVVI